jgi:hypothetical protein
MRLHSNVSAEQQPSHQTIVPAAAGALSVKHTSLHARAALVTSGVPLANLLLQPLVILLRAVRHGIRLRLGRGRF